MSKEPSTENPKASNPSTLVVVIYRFGRLILDPNIRFNYFASLFANVKGMTVERIKYQEKPEWLKDEKNEKDAIENEKAHQYSVVCRLSKNITPQEIENIQVECSALLEKDTRFQWVSVTAEQQSAFDAIRQSERKNVYLVDSVFAKKLASSKLLRQAVLRKPNAYAFVDESDVKILGETVHVSTFNRENVYHCFVYALNENNNLIKAMRALKNQAEISMSIEDGAICVSVDRRGFECVLPFCCATNLPLPESTERLSKDQQSNLIIIEGRYLESFFKYTNSMEKVVLLFRLLRMGSCNENKALLIRILDDEAISLDVFQSLAWLSNLIWKEGEEFHSLARGEFLSRRTVYNEMFRYFCAELQNRFSDLTDERLFYNYLRLEADIVNWEDPLNENVVFSGGRESCYRKIDWIMKQIGILRENGAFDGGRLEKLAQALDIPVMHSYIAYVKEVERVDSVTQCQLNHQVNLSPKVWRKAWVVNQQKNTQQIWAMMFRVEDCPVALDLDKALSKNDVDSYLRNTDLGHVEVVVTFKH